MPFNFNLAQTGFQPNPNNCCGDYALDAILFDLNVHNPPQPENTYHGIQVVQIGLAPNSQALVDASILGGTHISLPSSIAIYAHQLGMAAEVFVNTPLLIAANIAFANVFPEETVRINNNHIQLLNFNGGNPTLQDILQDQNINYNHFVVLVNNGGHWVAVKREVNGFTMYDPANGAETLFNTNGNNLPNHYVWSGVAIGIN
jgi:hypothetical protein